MATIFCIQNTASKAAVKCILFIHFKRYHIGRLTFKSNANIFSFINKLAGRLLVLAAVGFGLGCCFIISFKFIMRLQTAKTSKHQSPAYGRRLAPEMEEMRTLEPARDIINVSLQYFWQFSTSRLLLSFSLYNVPFHAPNFRAF